MDIEKEARPTYAKKREFVPFVQTQKRDKNAFNGQSLFVLVKFIDQELKEGYRHCIDDFKQRYQEVLRVLGRIDIRTL